MKQFSLLFAVIAALLSITSCVNNGSSVVYSGKDIYIPEEFADMDLNDTLSRYCYARMDTTPNIVFFWEKGF